MTPAIRELTELFCTSVRIDDIDAGRRENLPPVIYSNKKGEKLFKLVLIDIDYIEFIDNSVPPTHDQLPVARLVDFMTLFPFHSDIILNETKRHYDLDTISKNGNVREQAHVEWLYEFARENAKKYVQDTLLSG